MTVYAADIKVYATAYIQAGSPEEALAKLQSLANLCIELPDGQAGDVVVSGARFDDPRLPELSIAPMMSIPKDQIEDMDADELEIRE